MIILRKPTAKIQDYLYNQLEVYGDDYTNYVSSPYIHTYIYNNKKYIYNILTDEILELEIDEILPIDKQIKGWYLFYKDLDPYTIATMSVKLNLAKIRTDLNPTPNRLFTILTTTACNARCQYCFEKGRITKTMSNDTALNIAKYLESQYCGYQIEICWFGGEPTLNTKAIDIITEYLDSKNIPYASAFITNGSKLKDISLYKILYKWRTSTIQITLDGVDDRHDNIKQFVDNSTFKDIKEGLDKFIGTDVWIGLRMNIGPDKNELPIKEELARWMVNTYGKYDNFSVSTSFVYDTEFNKFTMDERSRELEYNQKIHEILRKSPIYRQNSFLPSASRDLYGCIAQSRSGNTIDVDGNFQICQYYTDQNTSLGNIVSGISKLDTIKYVGVQKLEDKCKYCKYYPSCKYLQCCKSASTCSTLDISKLDLNTDEYIRNYVDGRRDKICI